MCGLFFFFYFLFNFFNEFINFNFAPLAAFVMPDIDGIILNFFVADNQNIRNFLNFRFTDAFAQGLIACREFRVNAVIF